MGDININEEFFVTAYTEVDAHAKPTNGLKLDEFIFNKNETNDFLFFLKHNNTNILSEIENDLQSLCEKNGRPLLTALIDINLSIKFAEDAILLSGGFGKENMTTVFYNLLNYLHDAKKNASNVIAFEGYRIEIIGDPKKLQRGINYV